MNIRYHTSARPRKDGYDCFIAAISDSHIIFIFHFTKVGEIKESDLYKID
jgi:hypothetical protein